MTATRKIRAKDVVNDIRGGLTNLQLMEKYDLSSKGLQSLFTKLKDVNAIRPGELDGRVPRADDTVGVEQHRIMPRNYVLVHLPIHEVDQPAFQGNVRDITEKGIQVAGIPTKAGDKKAFVIASEDLTEIRPIEFHAQCRWSVQESGAEPCVAGFLITDITDNHLQQLRKLINVLTFGD